MSGLATPRYAHVADCNHHSLLLTLQSTDHCASNGFCASRAFRWPGLSNSVRIRKPHDLQVTIGQRVGLIVSPAEQLRLATLQFGAALLGLFLGLAAGLQLAGPAGGLAGSLFGISAALAAVANSRFATPKIRIKAIPGHSAGTLPNNQES